MGFRKCLLHAEHGLAQLHAGGAAGVGEGVASYILRFTDDRNKDDLVAGPLGAERENIGEPLRAGRATSRNRRGSTIRIDPGCPTRPAGETG